MKHIFISIVLLSLTACHSNSLYFGVDSSMGLDVSGTSALPNDISLSAKRKEILIIPYEKKSSTDTNTKERSVYASIDADIQWFGGDTILETFATGRAADCFAIGVLKKEKPEVATGELKPQLDELCPDDTVEINPVGKVDEPLNFGSTTTIGLNISVGLTEASRFIFGYKRRTAVKIPLNDDGFVRSTFADIAVDTINNGPIKGEKDQFVQDHGLRIRQVFATGEVADLIAKKTHPKEAGQ